MSEKYKKACKYLNYVQHLLLLISTITVCVSIFVSLVYVPVGIRSFAIEIKICSITARIKNYKPIIKKKKKYYSSSNF